MMSKSSKLLLVRCTVILCISSSILGALGMMRPGGGGIAMRGADGARAREDGSDAAPSSSPSTDSNKKEEECMWRHYSPSRALSAWEFQLQPHRRHVRDRDDAHARLEAALRRLSSDRVEFQEGSMWMTVYEEISHAVTTRHGHPLHPERCPEGRRHPFPWRGFAALRLRRYLATTTGSAPPRGAGPPAPGTADVTFKQKAIKDPRAGAGPLELPERVGAARLTAKMEQDVHCDHARATMSPSYRPVSPGLDVSTLQGVAAYFPNLAAVALVDAREALPLAHRVWRSKAVWAMRYAGVEGEASLVVKYNTSLSDAMAGASPKNGEVSLRIRREVAGDRPSAEFVAALDAMADACQALRDEGWDGKTPSWRRLQDEEEDEDDGGGEIDGDDEEEEEEEEEERVAFEM